MSDPNTPDDNASDVLNRADALLQRHKKPAAPASAPSASSSEIPVLTDIVLEGEVLPKQESAPKTASPQAEGGEIVSRVQAQNIEHAVYLKLKRGLDDQIAGVVRERYLPEIGAALEQALTRVTSELQSGIAELVRTSVAETLQSQLKQIQLQPAADAVAEQPSGIMPPSSAPPSSGITHGTSEKL